VGGGIVSQKYRLNHIETQYNDPQVGAFRLVRKYQLSYNNSGVTQQSRLASVQECDRNSSCLSPTMISWQEGVSGWSTTETQAGNNTSATMYLAYAIDLNGDGRTDLIYPQQVNSVYTWFYVLANASGGYNSPVQTSYTLDNSTLAQAMPVDFLGNGNVGLL